MKTNYVKRTQKDYPLSLKLQIVQSIGQGKLSTTEATGKYGIQCRKTVVNWLRKYGNFDWGNQTPFNMPKTPARRLLELQQEVRLPKKQKTFLEEQVERSDNKAIMFDMIIDLAEKEYNIPIRKNPKPE